MVMAASTRAQELMVAEASVQPLRWHVTLTWGAVQPWSVPPPWRTRINHKIQKRIAIKQDRSLRSNDRAAAEMARRPRTGRVPQLPTAFVL